MGRDSPMHARQGGRQGGGGDRTRSTRGEPVVSRRLVFLFLSFLLSRARQQEASLQKMERRGGSTIVTPAGPDCGSDNHTSADTEGLKRNIRLFFRRYKISPRRRDVYQHYVSMNNSDWLDRFRQKHGETNLTHTPMLFPP